MLPSKPVIEIYGTAVICASCVNAPSSKDTYEWLQAAINRKYPHQAYDIRYIDIEYQLRMSEIKNMQHVFKKMSFSIHLFLLIMRLLAKVIYS